MDSKYEGSNSATSDIYGKTWSTSLITIPFKLYSDCYINTKIGSTTNKIRCKKNTIKDIVCTGAASTDGTFNIGPA
jgi:hypothetical protein